MSREGKLRRQVEEVISKIADEGERIDAIARIRNWFGPRDDSRTYPVIQSYLIGSVSLTEAIDQITGPIDAALLAGRRESISEMDIYYSFFHSAKRISFRDIEKHSKLVALFRAYKSHPGPSEDPKEPSGFYKSLPNFYMAARETVNDAPGGGSGFSDPEIHAWANLNYFFAQLTANADGLANFWMYCIWAMRDALENDHTVGNPDEVHSASTESQRYNAFVPAAAVWVLALREKLYENEHDFTPTRPNQGSPARGGELWKGGPVFSKTRWALWKKRFGEISDMDEVSDETRAIAKEAFNVMVGCEAA